MASKALLSIRNLSKSFFGRRVLHAVDLDVMAGEVHALVGQNGSGKSTLIKCLSGYHAPDAGAQLVVGATDVPLPLDPQKPRVLGLSFVHQPLGLAPDLTVLENLSVGGFNTGLMWRIRWGESEREVHTALARVGGNHIDPHALIGSLSEVERAMVAIARALQELERVDAGVLVLDEPTAYLPRDGVERLFDTFARVTGAGAGVLFVTHRLDEVRSVADRVTVLRDGERVGTAEASSLSERQLVELIVGRPMSELYPLHGDVREDVVLAVEDASGSKVDGFSVSLHRGETVGVTGLVGMGQETIPYLLFGADAASSGRIAIDSASHNLEALRPDSAIRMGIGLVPADRLRTGGVGAASARENITVTTLREFFRRGRIDRRRERGSALDLMQAFDVRPRDPDHPFAQLSSGNQQKVVLAKWFARRPQVLLLHEPTQGIDVGARQEVFRHIRRFTDEGGAVLIASTEYEDLAHLCDRAIVFRDGHPVAELQGERLTPESIVEQAYVSTRSARGSFPANGGGS
jgi:ribose transport system ATP-binding protein